MDNGKARVVTGAIVAVAILFASSANIHGFPGGEGDGDKLPSACASCHSSPGSGIVNLTASTDNVSVNQSINVTATVTEQALTANGIVGVFLLKGPAGTQESVTKDGWKIVRDPNGGARNYVEKGGLSPGVPVTFTWALDAPPATGNYTLYANVKHGGEGSRSETSASLNITVSLPQIVESAPPVIGEPAFPVRARIGSVQNISARMTDDREGVLSASVHYRLTGNADFTEGAMARTEGTELDGNWSLGISVGPAPGTFEFFLCATDGNHTTRRPADGTLAMTIVAPGLPEISAPALPERSEPLSTLNISARIFGRDHGIELAVVRYRMPGATDFATRQMGLANGTDHDGQWTVEIGTGPVPGVMELYLAATDGQNEARSPATGPYTILIIKPEGPALEVTAPAAVTIGSDPEVRVKASDRSGVIGVQVNFKRDGEATYRVAEMTLRSGNGTDGEWAASLPVGNATGNYSFFVVAQSSRSDSQSEPKTIKVLPDLYVTKMTFSKKGILVKEDVYISAVIENRGDKAVTGLTVHFLDLSYSVGDIRNIRLLGNVTVPANGHVTVKALWVPQVEGTRDIAVVLDPDGAFEEGNEENNELVTTVPVDLEPGIGVLLPIPSLGEVWVQLIVILGAGAAVVWSIFKGWARMEGQGGSGAGKGKGSGGRSRKPDQGV